jgi:5-(carboxyamino)imidazole ribonucleotide synthase
VTPYPQGADNGQVIPPGSTIGILGGGQLGRMTAEAASRLGYRCHVYCPEPDAPAGEVAFAHTAAGYGDLAALEKFARSVDVVTFEFENVPASAGEALAAVKPTRPSPRILHVTQQRLREKGFLRSIGVPTTSFSEVADRRALDRALTEIGVPSVLKSASFGYDGKGQARIDAAGDLDAAWKKAMGGSSAGEVAILEGFVDFALEISVVIARGIGGAMSHYIPVENRHRNHILSETIAPARIASATTAEAVSIAERVVTQIGLVGLMGVEMFVTRDGGVLVNELAPRPHNSGHWTMDACLTSQFEQFVRAICGLPLGSTERHSDAVMRNLLGEEANEWREILSDPCLKLHLYGKREERPGRKMGHVNRLYPRSPN